MYAPVLCLHALQLVMATPFFSPQQEISGSYAVATLYDHHPAVEALLNGHGRGLWWKPLRGVDFTETWRGKDSLWAPRGSSQQQADVHMGSS